MARRTPELDTPFRRGERVLTTRDFLGIGKGTTGKVKLANGLGDWRRYWVRFDGGKMMGQVSHHDLVRPDQLDEWAQREEEREQAALLGEQATAEAAEATSAATNGDGGDGGIASRIPPDLLERSRAAKQRLLG